jgi:chorismate mutase
VDNLQSLLRRRTAIESEIAGIKRALQQAYHDQCRELKAVLDARLKELA